MIRADLHVHSTVSDGSMTIPELICEAKDRGTEVIAVTDHDTLSHLEQIPENPAIPVIGGVEISAIHKKTGIKAHILGYNIQNVKLVTELTQPLLEARSENSFRQTEILKSAGFFIDTNQMKKADGKYLYKQHIMEWLVQTGQAGEMFGSTYRNLFKNGGICDLDIEYIDVREAVAVIHEAGGMAVLAHPGQQKNFWMIPELVHLGLNGIERNHPEHSQTDLRIIQELASEHGLFLTGGSDYHGRYQPLDTRIGDFISEESGVMQLCQKSYLGSSL